MANVAGHVEPSMAQRPGLISVIAHPQSYVNIFYLFLSFPLGIFYFVLLVTGLALGFGLFITWLGIPILLLVLGGSWVLSESERHVAITLLQEDIPPTSNRPTSTGLWSQVKAHLTNRVTWTGVLYLFLKFPLGIASFVIAVTLISVTGALLAAPIWYSIGSELSIPAWDVNTSLGDISVVGWQIDTLGESFILTLIGIPMVFISLHLMNATAYVSGWLARVMLGKLQEVEPVRVEQPATTRAPSDTGAGSGGTAAR